MSVQEIGEAMCDFKREGIKPIPVLNSGWLPLCCGSDTKVKESKVHSLLIDAARNAILKEDQECDVLGITKEDIITLMTE